MPDFTADDVDSLAAKLDALDLTDGERAALDALCDRGTPDDEVEGHMLTPPTVDRFANQEVSYFRPRLMTVVGRYIGETEKN